MKNSMLGVPRSSAGKEEVLSVGVCCGEGEGRNQEGSWQEREIPLVFKKGHWTSDPWSLSVG